MSYELLLEASKSGNIFKLNYLLRMPSVLVFAAVRANLALRLAAKSGHLMIVRRLLEIPAVLAKIDIGYTMLASGKSGLREIFYDNASLRKAIEGNHTKVVFSLLQAYKEVDKPFPIHIKIKGYKDLNHFFESYFTVLMQQLFSLTIVADDPVDILFNYCNAQTKISPLLKDATQEATVDEIYKLKAYLLSSSLQTHFADLIFRQYGTGNITVFLGASSSGKTTLINALLRSNPEFYDYSRDFRICMELGNIIKKVAAKHYYELLEATYHKEIGPIALCKDKIKFKRNISSIMKKTATEAAESLQKMQKELFEHINWEAIMDDIFDQIIEHSKRGRATLFDTATHEELGHFLSKNVCAPIRIVPVFCPLLELAKRMKERNRIAEESGEHSNKRRGLHFLQFSKLYRSKQADNEQTFSKLTRTEVDDAFNTLSPSLIDSEQFIQQKSNFLNALGFISSETNSVEVTARFQHYNTQPVDTATEKRNAKFKI